MNSIYIDLLLLALIGAGQIYVTVVGANPPKKGESKKPHNRKLIIGGAIGVLLTVTAAWRQYNQNDHPEVELAHRKWDTDYLDPNITQHLSVGVTVSSGTARQAQMYVRAFVLPGAATAESDHEAIVKFKKLMAETPMQPQDAKENKNPWHYEEPFTFENAQIKDLESGRATLYSMVYIEWQNKQGLTLKYSNYVSMQVPPRDGYVANIRWNRLIQ
jgi:hypothetical protein